MYRIDKSVFSAEERAQYEALIAKAKVDPEAAEEEMEEEFPEFPPKKTKKAELEDDDDMDVEMTKSVYGAAMQRLEMLEKSIEMKEFSEIAKRYAPLGEKEDELAVTLYEMKKSSEANYNAYIDVLEKSLGLVEKSGLFAEIGKSAPSSSAGSSATAKAETKAEALMKADPSMDYDTAIAKAWEDPALMAEYDAEYFG